jgi:hypothetical protein
MISNQLGFSLKKIAKKAAGGVKTAAKAGVKVALLPQQLAIKAAIGAVKKICAVPRPALQAGAMAAQVSISVVDAFCAAVKMNSMAGIRKNLPGILKIAIKLSAQGMFPGIGPVMTAMKYVPGLKNFAGASDELLGGEELMDAYICGTIDSLSDSELAAALDGDKLPVMVVGGLAAAALLVGWYTWRKGSSSTSF